MKAKHILMMLAVSLAALAAEKVFTAKDFKWSTVPGVKMETVDGKPFLIVDIPKGEVSKKQNCAVAALDVEAIKGSLFSVSVKVRGKDVTEPSQRHNGVKCMVHYVKDDGSSTWPGASIPRGTFDWRNTGLLFWMPPNVTKAVLLLGLQDSAGHVEYDLSTLRCVSSSLAEDNYIVKYPERVQNTPPLRGVMSPRPERFKPSDLTKLAEWNVNLVRFQICRHWAQIGSDTDIEEYDNWFHKCLDSLDALLPDAQKLGIQFIIDLHWPVGGRVESNEMRIFYEKKYRDHFIELWKEIAARYKGKSAIWAYDIINEPKNFQLLPVGYWEVQKMTAEAIRAIDPDTPIVIESNMAANPTTFSYLPSLPLDNIIYQAHMYYPGQFTHQGVFGSPTNVAYPGVIGSVTFDRAELKKYLEPVRAFQLKHKCRIYIGEFSAATWAPGAEKYLADCISIFEEYGWDWTYHAFRESPVWSLEHEGPDRKHIVPSKDNPRLRVMKAAWAKNQK
ncbi:MAG: cellulase family glycosylhydrolase [Victivallales bacterium]|nr:cellulase family glycosylhydrolase [Victivallales bacterium]